MIGADQLLNDALARFAKDAKVVPLREARRAFERSYILAALAHHNWRVADAARALGLQRPNLYRKARQLRIALRADAADPTALAEVADEGGRA
jgi:two-component system nitrogen regulation response regulator NtrX